MASFLYRLGRVSAQRAWIVIASWFAFLVIAGGAFLAFGGALATTFSIPGTETERVTQQLGEKIPALAGSSATVTFSTANGSAITPEQQLAIAEVLVSVAQIDGVAGTTDPFTAQAALGANVEQLFAGKDQLAEQQAQLNGALAQLEAQGGLTEELAAQFAAQQGALDAAAGELAAGERLLALASGLRMVSADGSAALGSVAFGQDAFSLDASIKEAVTEALDAATIDGIEIGYGSIIATNVNGLLGVGEVIGVLIAALVLLVMIRAVLPAMTPLIGSVVGVGVGVAGSMAFSNVVDMSSVTPVLGVMLGLAVGIDYSLFILYRHRRQMLQGAKLDESIGVATGTAGNAVVFAGSTVIVALLALVVTGIPFLTVMGVVAAACVLVAVLVSVTFTPALLALVGDRVMGRGKSRASARTAQATNAASPVKPMKNRTAVLMGLIGTIALLVIAAPALSMRLGMPEGNAASPDSPEYLAHHVVANQFGAGNNGPLLVVATLPATPQEGSATAAQLDLAEFLDGQENVVSVAPVATSEDGTMVAFQVIPGTGASSEETEQLVHDLRAASPLDSGVELGVAGATTSAIDVSAKLDAALPAYLAVVVGLSLIILIFVFRSLVVPVVATGGFVLSLFAALGAVTAVYQWGWLGDVLNVHNPAPILSFAPILIMGVLFGLAMDYQLFLVSGMREAYVHGAAARTAVMAGLRNGRAVVTAAAIIMISVFGGFVFSHLTIIRPLGFGLAVGVLFDAFVVRMLLVPSAMHLLGSGAWWIPKWLDRILPNVDVEGASLERPASLQALDEAATKVPASV